MIIIFGAPGAGKTVQGQLLASKYRWKWISGRDLLLDLNDPNVTTALNNGMYLDEDVVAKAMENAIGSGEHGTRMVLDGFPNSVKQVYWLRDHGLMSQVEGAISLQVPRGELWMRVVKRGRVDDTRAAFERRIDLYERTEGGMLTVLKANGVKIDFVSGCNDKKDVLERIEEKLASWEIIPKKQFETIREK